MPIRQVGAFLLLALVACAPKPQVIIQNNPNAPHTGETIFEEVMYLDQKDQVKLNQIYFVQVDLNLRTTATVEAGNIAGRLKMNDQVQVVDVRTSDKSDFVEVAILKTEATLTPSPHYFLSYRYLDLKPRQSDAVPPELAKNFIVINIATERIRIYERCRAFEGCPHKMMAEAETVVGQDAEDGRLSAVGHQTIDQWVKFYEDQKGLYPAWYRPNYPALPGKDAGALEWFGPLRYSYLPPGPGQYRGAFGWYTALFRNPSDAQWLHGTYGWGENSHRFIQMAKTWWANAVSDPRSHGCTRTDNETIAYLRQLAPVGTPVFKIYAREVLADRTYARYPARSLHWKYILTKRGYGIDGEKSDAADVRAAGVTAEEILDEGTYVVDTHPDAIPLKEGDPKTDETGDVYSIGAQNFRGLFLVDTGEVIGYQHPAVKIPRTGQPTPYPSYFSR